MKPDQVGQSPTGPLSSTSVAQGAAFHYQGSLPGLNGLVVYNPTSVDIGQRFKREPWTFLLQNNPSGKCLFNDPPARTLSRAASWSTFLASGSGT